MRFESGQSNGSSPSVPFDGLLVPLAPWLIQTANLFIDRGDNGAYYRILELELEHLRQTLTLTNLAIRTYEGTPLGQNLERSIMPEVEQIYVVLRELFDRIGSYRQGLWPTFIHRLWCEVWWRGCEVDDKMFLLRSKLAAHQQVLGNFLMALNSVSWTEIGNGMRTGHVSLEYFYSRLRQGPLSLRRLQVDMVTIVDHLGRNILVPILFCSTWTVFDFIINGYCKDCPGNRFVERGDYQVLRADNSQAINRLEIADIVEPGMILEMSVVIRWSTAFQDNKGKCPRYYYVNSNVTATNCWIECYKCSGKFQIAPANPKDGSGNESDRLGGGNDGKERNEDDDNWREYGDEEREDTVSAPAQLRDRVDASGSQRQRPPEDDDDTTFFRLIHVICKRPSDIFTTTYTSAHALPQQGWDILCADPRRSNAILSHAEKALMRTADEEHSAQRECWITCSTVDQSLSQRIDFILSCTDNVLGHSPIFIYSTRHSSHLDGDFLLPRLSFLVKALHSAVNVSRVFSVFAPDPVTEMFTKLWANLTGIRFVPQPYYSAAFSACTKRTLIDKPTQIHLPLKDVIRAAVKSDIPSVAELCYDFALDSDPFILTREGAVAEATELVRNKQVWVLGIQQDKEPPDSELASIVCTARSSATVTAITKIYTKPKWRKLGCSERLVRHFRKHFLKTKQSVVAYVARDNQTAAKVYNRVGFIKLDEIDRSAGGIEPWLEVGFDRDMVKLGHW